MNSALLEPRDVSDDERVSPRLLSLLPPEHAGLGAIHDFINEQQHSDDWFSNSLYSDRMYDLFPRVFCGFLDEFTAIMGSTSKPFPIRIQCEYNRVMKYVSSDRVRKQLIRLRDKIREFYFRTNVYAMRCISLEFVELIGHLLGDL
jgi:hypothetical protein